ncbi:MAG: HEAT repeat domain-containing protein [Myxococcota bacterium]
MKLRCMAVCVATLSLHLVSFDTRAQGVVLSPAELEAPVRARLETAIARAKQRHPEAFVRVRNLRGHRPETYRRYRNQRPNVMPELQVLGEGGAWALIDAVAFTSLQRGNATQEEWSAVREGLLLALGDHALSEAGVVLREVFDRSREAGELRAAAISLGKRGGAEDRRALLAGLRRGGQSRNAALWGLRHVRRPEVVDAVAPLLGDADEHTARLAARALGYVGSSWAWKTGNAGKASDEMPIRTRCAQVLLEAFVQRAGEVRKQVARSLAMVEHPDMRAMIDARLAVVIDGEDRTALRELRKAF